MPCGSTGPFALTIGYSTTGTAPLPGGAGFNRGSFFDQRGQLVASTAQESLIRVRRDQE